MKQLVKEKENHSIGAARWAKDGDTLFIGYASGKVLRCKLEIVRNKVHHLPVHMGHSL